jgi:hypothetical protein
MKRIHIVLLLSIGSLSVLGGCGLWVAHKSSGVQSDQVLKIELFEYPWGQESQTVRRAVVVPRDDNREVIDELTGMFNDVPVTRFKAGTAEELVGREALSVRYHLDGGEVVDVTRVFVFYHDVVIIWPDGSANHTEWGAPDLVDYYGQFGTIDEVDAIEAPEAQLPE